MENGWLQAQRDWPFSLDGDRNDEHIRSSKRPPFTKIMRLTVVSVLCACLLLTASGCGAANVENQAPSATSLKIVSIQVTADVAQFPFFGDLWANTWADDDRVYFSFGDGTGVTAAPSDDGLVPGAFTSPWQGAQQISPGCFRIPPAPPSTTDPLWGLFCRTFDCSATAPCYPLSHFTDSGLVIMTGSPPNFSPCVGSQCLAGVDVPNESLPPGAWRNDDKASSMLSAGGTLFYAGHDPSVTPSEGYIAESRDKGKSWQKIAGTPWTGSSPFRVLMFINMGEDDQLNTDGFVYAMGTPLELETTLSHPQPVYLARVPAKDIDEYGEYQYLTSVDGSGNPAWSSSQTDATPLAGLSTLATGSAMYHAGTGQYLFLAGVSTSNAVVNPHGTLFAAPHPWGPWAQVGEIPGINISMLISKGAGATSVYYTAAGGTEGYRLNIGRIDMQVVSGSNERTIAPAEMHRHGQAHSSLN